MKKSCLLIALLLGSLTAQMFAQQPNGLYVHSLEGTVTYCPFTMQEWTQPVVKQSVSRLDSMQIGLNSKVVLVDAANGNVYRCAEPQRDNILHLIQWARKQANGLLESLSRQLVKNAMGKNRASKVIVSGVTTRAEDNEHIHDSIACLAIETSRFTRKNVSDNALTWEIKEEEEEEGGWAYFVIKNQTPKAYCVNMLAVNRASKTVSLCIVPSPDTDPAALVVPAGETLTLSMFPFIPDAACDYILFATQTTYSPAAVQNLLRYPEELNCK